MGEVREHHELQPREEASREAPAREALQVAGAALAAAALVSPAALGGIPVLPVTIDDERRRQQEEILAQSESDVGVHQDVQAAATALTLSQRRLAAATREVEGTHARQVQEADVVHAAHLVASGSVSPHKSRAFRSALGRVALDTVDLFILQSDEDAAHERQVRQEALEADEYDGLDPYDELDPYDGLDECDFDEPDGSGSS